ncbi:MAG: helix-turn-helix domain-containing protein [Gemmatirosa sp.]
MDGARPTAAAPPVVTLLTPDERLRVQAAMLGAFEAVHRDAMEDVVHELRGRTCAAVVVSTTQVARGGRSAAARLGDLIRAHPRVPIVALVGDAGPGVPQLLLALGRAGVRCLVDARHADGWRSLRDVLGTDPARQVGREALAAVAADLDGAGEGCRRFFGALFEVPPEPVTVQMLAQQLGVRPTTLMSRFARAGLPSPKRYLAFARLARAARLLENRGATLAAAADQLEYSSAQSFGRHVRMLLGVGAADFRRSYDAARMVALFREELVLPYRERLRRFVPLGRV